MSIAKTLMNKFEAQGLKQRESQKKMIDAAYEAFSSKQITVIEAPTGVGKTLAYLIAALKAKPNKAKVIVSTATVALQEQLIEKDIPLLEKILEREIPAGLAKGRKRYVCLSRLYQVDDEENQIFKTELQDRLESNRWDGEKESLSGKVNELEWAIVSTDQSGCSGSRCPYYEDCVFYKRRRKVLAADIVVVNHSLLLADLSLGGGAVLPPVEDSIYILDECHHLPEKALGHFAKQSMLMKSVDWINVLTKSLNSVGLYLTETQYHPDRIQEYTRSLVESLSLMRAHIEMQKNAFQDDVWRVNDDEALKFSQMAENIIESGTRLADENSTMLSLLDDRYEHERNLNKEKAAAISQLLSRLNFAEERLENLCETWAAFIKPRAYKEAPYAKWLALRASRDKSEPNDYVCHVAPIAAGRELYDLFWSRLTHGAVLCSATIRSLGAFDEFMRRSGLKLAKKTTTLALTSDFDYSQSVLFIPSMKIEPTWQQFDAHAQESAEILSKIIFDHVGNLVLFASRKAMEKVLTLIDKNILDKVLVQGAAGKSQLIKLHKKRVDEGKTSVIFGLASFAEGLDLKGHYCEHVVIHKLPFAAPADPIEFTRNEWIQFNQLNPFMVYTLPNASLRLTQYVGRLLRAEEDRGMVTILDKRLYTKAYGKSMLASLPAFRRCIDQPIEAALSLPFGYFSAGSEK